MYVTAGGTSGRVDGRDDLAMGLTLPEGKAGSVGIDLFLGSRHQSPERDRGQRLPPRRPLKYRDERRLPRLAGRFPPSGRRESRIVTGYSRVTIC